MKKLLLTCALVAISASAQARDLWTKAQPTPGTPAEMAGGQQLYSGRCHQQLEMWQAASFDPAQIDKERAGPGPGHDHHARLPARCAVATGCAGLQEAHGRLSGHRGKHGIKPLFVLFDSCWDPNPKLGRSIRPFPACQFRLGARPGRAGAGGPIAISPPGKVCEDIVGSFATTIAFSAGMCGMSRTTAMPALCRHQPGALRSCRLPAAQGV